VTGAALFSVALQSVLALAIAIAPNATALSPRLPLPLPSELIERGGRRFIVPRAASEGSLAAWIVEPNRAPARGTVVLLHGVRLDKGSSTRMALSLCDAGYRAILVDLPGHGESEGRYLTYGAAEAREVSRLLDAFAASGGQLGPLGAYGFSYGAAVAINLAAADRRVHSVVAVSPFASLREVLVDYRRKYLPAVLRVVPDAWFQQAIDQAAWLTSFDPDASAPIANIASASETLLIHGDADTQVPLRHSQKLEQAAGGRARLVVLHGATHDSMPLDATSAVRREALAWFDAHLLTAPSLE
jgi:pimeloyl-ACP methyl ester carboxylesterase